MYLHPAVPFSATATVVCLTLIAVGFLTLMFAMVEFRSGAVAAVFALPLLVIGLVGGIGGYYADNDAYHVALQHAALQHYGVRLDAQQASDLFTEDFFDNHYGEIVQGSTAVVIAGQAHTVHLYHVGQQWLLGYGTSVDHMAQLPALKG